MSVGLAMALTVCTATALAQGAAYDQQMAAGHKAASAGQHADASRIFALAVQEAEKSGKEDARLGASLTELGLSLTAERRFPEAETVLLRAAAVKEKALGPENPDFARALIDLGAVYRNEREHGKAEVPIRRAVGILERSLGPEHPEVAGNLTNLGGRLRDQGKFAEAEPVLKRALAIREKILPPNDPDLVKSLLGMANLYADQKKYAESEPLLQRAITILEGLKAFGAGYPNLPDTLTLYADVLRKTDRPAQASEIEARVKDLRAKYGAPEPRG
jgi:tetratricopeptide (TPR) repeat protein